MKMTVGNKVFEGTPMEIAEAVELFKSHRAKEETPTHIEAEPEVKPVTALNPLTTVLKEERVSQQPLRAVFIPRHGNIGTIKTGNKFCSRLRYERVKQGWTADYVGEMLGCSRSTYGLIENSKTPARRSQSVLLSEQFGIAINELFNSHGYALGFEPIRVIE